jgi:hypothetical protein
MKPTAKLIYKTCTSYLPTAFPAHFYGMPNGEVYLVYSRFYDIKFGKSGLEFVFAIHNEFSYDYENNKVIALANNSLNKTIFPESIDKPYPEFRIIEINRDIKSYGEAYNLLNHEAERMSLLAS